MSRPSVRSDALSVCLLCLLALINCNPLSDITLSIPCEDKPYFYYDCTQLVAYCKVPHADRIRESCPVTCGLCEGRAALSQAKIRALAGQNIDEASVAAALRGQEVVSLDLSGASTRDLVNQQEAISRLRAASKLSRSPTEVNRAPPSPFDPEPVILSNRQAVDLTPTGPVNNRNAQINNEAQDRQTRREQTEAFNSLNNVNLNSNAPIRPVVVTKPQTRQQDAQDIQPDMQPIYGVPMEPIQSVPMQQIRPVAVSFGHSGAIGTRQIVSVQPSGVTPRASFQQPSNPTPTRAEQLVRRQSVDFNNDVNGRYASVYNGQTNQVNALANYQEQPRQHEEIIGLWQVQELIEDPNSYPSGASNTYGQAQPSNNIDQYNTNNNVNNVQTYDNNNNNFNNNNYVDNNNNVNNNNYNNVPSYANTDNAVSNANNYPNIDSNQVNTFEYPPSPNPNTYVDNGINSVVDNAGPAAVPATNYNNIAPSNTAAPNLYAPDKTPTSLGLNPYILPATTFSQAPHIVPTTYLPSANTNNNKNNYNNNIQTNNQNSYGGTSDGNTNSNSNNNYFPGYIAPLSETDWKPTTRPYAVVEASSPGTTPAETTPAPVTDPAPTDPPIEEPTTEDTPTTVDYADYTIGPDPDYSAPPDYGPDYGSNTPELPEYSEYGENALAGKTTISFPDVTLELFTAEAVETNNDSRRTTPVSIGSTEFFGTTIRELDLSQTLSPFPQPVELIPFPTPPPFPGFNEQDRDRLAVRSQPDQRRQQTQPLLLDKNELRGSLLGSKIGSLERRPTANTQASKPYSINPEFMAEFRLQQCCKLNKITPFCQPLCSYRVSKDEIFTKAGSGHCGLRDAAIWIKCASGGVKNSVCCRRRGITACDKFCDGEINTNELLNCATDHLPEILQCHKQSAALTAPKT